MELDWWSVIIAIVGGAIWIERRLTRIETLLKGCPHVNDNSPLVGRKTGL